jgi:hypothetical protein
MFCFMFQYNYGGIQAKTQNVTSADSSDGDNDIDIVSSWNIAEYLPKATQVRHCHSQLCIKCSLTILQLILNYLISLL